LLIAAAERRNCSFNASGFYSEVADGLLGMRRFAAAIDHPSLGDFAQRTQCNIFADVQMRKQTQQLAIFSHERYASLAGFGWMAKSHRSTGQQNLALRRQRARAKQALQ
jgi:hypothetical protein